MTISLLPGEEIHSLIDDKLSVIQHIEVHNFGTDTVLLADFATVKHHDLVCDLGCGTGVIALLLAEKTRARLIHGLELQSRLADMANRSVSLNNLTDKIVITRGNLKEATKFYGSSCFDLVVCNPPYYKAGSGRKNPNLYKQIARHEVECTLGDVAKACSQIVRSRGRVAMVHKPARLAEISRHFDSNNLALKRIQPIYSRAEDEAELVLLEAIKDGSDGVTIEPPLFIYQESGGYSEELLKIYFGGSANG